MPDIYKHRKIGVRCYDNGGKTADRYTVVYTGRYPGPRQYVGMSQLPMSAQGVGMHGESEQPIDNRGYGQTGGYAHLGKPITFDQLPPQCQRLVFSDAFDLAIDATPRRAKRKELGRFARGYLTAAVWADLPEEHIGELIGVDDVDDKSKADAIEECRDFMDENMPELLQFCARYKSPHGDDSMECAGHDFWLTRQGHGTGYWDRGLGALGDTLSKSAKTWGERCILVEDGKIFIE